jgi:hypothetical protein
MQGEGFNVRLDSLAAFQETVAETLKIYELVVGQLDDADITKAGGGVESLLGKDSLPGSTRVYETSRTMLGNYAGLYSKIIQTHEVIAKRLDIAATALAENRELYSRHEVKQEAVFRDLLQDLPRPAEGGGRGTTAQD